MKARLATSVLAAVAALLATTAAVAGTKYQTSLVPIAADTMPGFSASGSKLKLDDQLSLKGKIKKVVDGSNARVTTDGVPSGDDYSVEVDLGLASGSAAGTVTVPFDLNNGNGKFSADLTGHPALAGGISGDGVAVTAVRVKNGSGMLIGVGGFAIK
jgi:hypothetical protein